MASHRPRVKLFTGVPLPSDLTWNESTLTNTLTPSFTAFLNTKIASQHPAISQSSVPDPSPKWRTIPLNSSTHLPNDGLQHPFLPAGAHSSNPSISFTAPPYLVSFGSVPEDTTIPEGTHERSTLFESEDPFLQYSLAFHETLQSSQLAPSPTSIADANNQENTSFTSFLTTASNTDTTTEESSPIGYCGLIPQAPLIIPPSLAVTPLSALPTASHLLSIHPQTPTPTLLCALLSKPSSRTVTIRRTQRPIRLQELTIGDETNRTLRISIWTTPTASSTAHTNLNPNSHDPLAQTLQDVQVGDLLLLRNIALTTYRDTVHGQSLNPHIARARTSITVLVRAGGLWAVRKVDLPVGVREKAERVRAWAGVFVGAGAAPRKRRRVGEAEQMARGESDKEELPPDTWPGEE